MNPGICLRYVVVKYLQFSKLKKSRNKRVTTQQSTKLLFCIEVANFLSYLGKKKGSAIRTNPGVKRNIRDRGNDYLFSPLFNVTNI